jgi:hypothetical protein
MKQDLFKTLKELKQIQPDSAYSRQSRLLILNSKPVSQPVSRAGWFSDVLSNLYPARLAFAAGAIIVLLAVAGSVYYFNNRLNQNNLVVRASEMNASIQVKLNEIKYLLENKSVDFENILTTQALLEKAINELKAIPALNSENGDLSESLDKIKSVQEIFYQIDEMLQAQN